MVTYCLPTERKNTQQGMSDTGEHTLVWPRNDDGALMNEGALVRVRPGVRSMVRHFAELARRHYRRALHSAYLVGPTARGCEGPLAFLLVLQGQVRQSELVWPRMAVGSLRVRWPDAAGLDVRVVEKRSLDDNPELFDPARFVLATSSVCFAGADLARHLPAQPLGGGYVNHALMAARASARHHSSIDLYAASEAEIRHMVRARATSLLAACLALSVVREQVYTDVPMAQAQLAALQFPERERDLIRLAQWAVSPPGHAPIALPLLDSMSAWFHHQAERWFAAHNPARAAVLPL